MSYTLKGIRAGRSWNVDRLDETGQEATDNAVSQVERTYIIQRAESDVAWSEADEKTMQEVLASLPKIGDAHHSGNNVLRCTNIKFQEGSGADKLFLYATVSFTRMPEPEAAQGQDPQCYVEAWGWHTGAVQRDLMDRSGLNENPKTGAKPILNSAGQPFDSVPQIDWPAPTFTKVFKTKARYSDVVSYYSKTNDATITIGDISSDAGMLRVVQADEDRIFNDPLGFNYRYTISLQRMDNEVEVWKSAQEPRKLTQIGWDVAVVDMGTHAKRQYAGGGVYKIERFTDTDENGNEYPVTNPVPLNGAGDRLAADQTPISKQYQTYAKVAIPRIFYSEP